MLPIHESRLASKVAASGDASCAVRMPAWVDAITVPSRGAFVPM